MSIETYDPSTDPTFSQDIAPEVSDMTANERTEEQILSNPPSPDIVMLGEREYRIKPQSLLRCTAWAKRLAAIMRKSGPAIKGMIDAWDNIKKLKEGNSGNTNFVELLPAMIDTVPDLIDLITECVFEYSEVLSQDREYIMSNATMGQFLQLFFLVFVQVKGPFSNWISVLSAMTPKA